MFEDKRLVIRFGSWVRVQVAFYDFIFEQALSPCPKHFREKAAEEALTGGFADGEDLYERSVKTIEQTFSSFESAWGAFVKVSLARRSILKSSSSKTRGTNGETE